MNELVDQPVQVCLVFESSIGWTAPALLSLYRLVFESSNDGIQLVGQPQSLYMP